MWRQTCPSNPRRRRIVAFIVGRQKAVVEKILKSGGCLTGCGKRNPIEARGRFRGGFRLKQ